MAGLDPAIHVLGLDPRIALGFACSTHVMAGLDPAIHVLGLDPRIALRFASLVRGFR
jgi:ABC-type antimicrobial peptide transport system permease subunit